MRSTLPTAAIVFDGKIHTVTFPRKRQHTDINELRRLNQQDIIAAHYLWGRTDANGNFLKDDKGRDLPALTYRELTDGHPRVKPRPSLEEQIAQAKALPQLTAAQKRLAAEELLNQQARAREAAEAFAKLPLAEQRRIESDRRLAEAKAEVEREAIRSRPDFVDTLARLETLEFYAKHDPTLSAEVLELIQTQRQQLESTLDVPAAHLNLKQIQQVAFNQREAHNVKLREAVDAAERIAQPWRENMVFDCEPRRLIHAGIEMVSVQYKGKGLAISADLFDGKTHEEIAAAYFPETPAT